MTERYHIAVIGSGPAGLSAAARAAHYDQQRLQSGEIDRPTHILLEAFQLPAKTIQRYQKGKYVMAEPGFLNLRSDTRFGAGSREAILGNWDEDIARLGINVRYGAEVSRIQGERGAFVIQLAGGAAIEAEHVVLAIGLEGNPRRLGAPGDDAPIVQYTLDDPDAYRGETIVVVGAGDSAIENALALSRHNQVYIVNRREEFARAKEGNLTAVLRSISDPKVTLECFYRTSIKALLPPGADSEKHQLLLKTPDGEKPLACDRIIARLGAIPPRDFVERCGIQFGSSAADAAPVLSGRYESNVPGLYVVGSLAGYPLIKQAMNQGYDVIEYILGHAIKPADYPLLELQFGLLPYRREPEALLQLFQQRIPMFSQLNALAFRELIIESHVWVAFEEGPQYAETSARAAQLQRQAAAQDPPPRTGKLVKAGDYIYRSGDYTNTFFTIVEGEVTVELPERPGQVLTLKRGEFFGETSLLSGRPREGSAIAGKDCILVETPRRTMLKLMNGNETVKGGIDWIFIVRALQQHFAPNVSPKSLRRIAEAAQLRTFQARDALFREGERGDSLHIIRRGSVTLARKINGEDVVVTQLQSGQLVGEMALMGDPQRKESAVASVLTETIELNRESFLALVNLDTSCIEKLQRDASERAVALTTMASRSESGAVMAFLMAQGLGEATNALIIDENLCVGCDNCEKACAETHGGISRLDRSAGASYAQVHVPTACRHCEHPHCMKDCPPDAIHRAPSGEVFIDNKCIGCGNCQSNCPYGVIKLAYEAPKKPSLLSWMLFGAGSGPGEEPHYHPTAAAKAKGKKAVKCDACVDLPHGPACVSACPTGAAIRIGPDAFIELIAKH